MSVKKCGRSSCIETMSAKITAIIGGVETYICDPCYKELLLFKNTWKIPITKLAVEDNIKRFLNETWPGTYIELNFTGMEEYFNSLVKERIQ